MRALANLWGVVAVVCVAAGLVLVSASAAVAAPLKICVPEAEGKPIETPKGGALCSPPRAAKPITEGVLR
jgi:hypothetical protein